MLAACGGDGGSSTVSLKTEQDVTREIVNVIGLRDSAGSGSTSTMARSGVSGSMRARLAGTMAARDVSGPGRAQAKTTPAKENVPCDSGAYVYFEFFNVARSLPLFGVNPPVDYYYYDHDDCRLVSGSESVTTNGYEEYGDNISYSSATAESPRYEYYAYGSGSGRYSFLFEDTSFDETFRLDSQGRGEYRDNGSSRESREIAEFDLAVTFGSFRESVELDAGATGEPLVIVDNYGAGNATIDGPFRYSSEACRGGRLAYTTLQPVTFASDDFGTYVNGGELFIESGSASVTLVFQSDGSALYELSSGGSGIVTRAELSAYEGCQLF
ncbi:MAG: hypothetical protein ACRES8_01615 [Nevskiaceae bacterium]